MNADDRLRFEHMLDAARMAVAMIQDESRASLDTDYKLRLALTKAVEIIGEAASKVTRETRTAYPHLPWNGMIGMRHVLTHDYFKVDLDVLWETVTAHLLPLIEALNSLLDSTKE